MGISSFLKSSSDVVKLYQDTVTSTTSWSRTGLSTTAYRWYFVCIEIYPDAGTADFTMRLNNISSNNYVTRYISGQTKLIVDNAATSAWQLAVTGAFAAQGCYGFVLIPVNRSGGVAPNYTMANADICDINQFGSAHTMVNGSLNAAGAAISRIDVLASANSSGVITLYGIK